MTVELQHANAKCTSTFSLRGTINQYARCDGCGATYRIRLLGDRVYVNQVWGAVKLEGGT